MKKLIIAAGLALASFAGLASASTNEEWYVLYKPEMRYCSLTATNADGKAMVAVDRLGKTNSGAPKYASAELVKLFGGDQLDADVAEEVDDAFTFWLVDKTGGALVLKERTFKEIWRKESAGDAD